MKKTLLTALCALSACVAFPEVTLPHIFGSGMVLQRNETNHFRGTALPGSKVKARTSWSKKEFTAVSDSNGNWNLAIPVGEATYTPQTITFSDSDGKTVLDNLLIGDVWICSGQSNMEMPVMGYASQPVEGSLNEIMQGSSLAGKMRFFTVGRTRSYNDEKTDCEGSWLEASPESVARFSAIGYFFGKPLQSALDIPIGLITANWGDTKAEAWMPLDALRECVTEEKFEEKHHNHWCKPSEMYCAMIAPIRGVAAKGFVWYQGESNRVDSDHYDILLAKLAERWRSDWNDTGNSMPFYYVMIAPYIYTGTDNIDYPLFTEAQTRALDLIPNSGMAPTTDLGEVRSIHPGKKREVGERLAALALSQTYGHKGFEPVMPMLESYEVKEGKIVLTMKNAGQGMAPWTLTPLLGFEIAGADRVFHKANAWTSDNPRNMITVWSDEVKEPVAVRYAFRNFIPANLTNTFGIPAAPFRTDKW